MVAFIFKFGRTLFTWQSFLFESRIQHSLEPINTVSVTIEKVLDEWADSYPPGSEHQEISQLSA